MKNRFLATALSVSMVLSAVPVAGVSAAEFEAANVTEVSSGFSETESSAEQEGMPLAEGPEENAGFEGEQQETVTPVLEEPQKIVTPMPEVEENQAEEIDLDDVFTDALPDGSEPEVPQDGKGEQEIENEVTGEEAAAYLAQGIILVSPADWILQEDGSYSLKKTLIKAEPPASHKGSEAQAPEEETVFRTDDTADVELMDQVPETAADPSQAEIVQEDGQTTEVMGLYTAADGLLRIQTKGGSEGYYYFDENGCMVQGRAAVAENTPGFPDAEAGTYYFLETEVVGEEATPTDSKLGQLQKNYWQWDGKAFHYYNASTGKEQTVQEYIDGLNKYNGYLTIDGANYALDENGVPFTGCKKLLDGYFYYFSKDSEIPGQMCKGSMIKGTDNGAVWWRYFREEDGRFIPYKGYTRVKVDKEQDPDIDPERYYMVSTNGYLQRNKLCWTSEDGYYYYADSNGKVLKSTIVTVGNDKYGLYSNGRVIQNKIYRLYNNHYYFAKNGKMAKNKLITYGKNVFYAGADGALVKNKMLTINGKQYYFNTKGVSGYRNQWARVPLDKNRFYYFGADTSIVKTTGWQTIFVGNQWQGWFYFTPNGKHYTNNIMRKVGGKSYLFTQNGAVASGRELYNGNYYYFMPSTPNQLNGYIAKGPIYDLPYKIYYYAESNGVLAKGWKQINGLWYYFQENNSALRNSSAQLNGIWGWLNDMGVWCTGWVSVPQADQSEKRYYINPETGDYYKDCWKNIDGFNYYFNSDGSVNTKLDMLPGFNAGGYAVGLNRAKNIMTVYTADRKTPIRSFTVSVGKPETPTITGTYRLTSTGQRWTALMGPSYGQWAVNISGGYFIHSVPNTAPNPYTLYRHDFCYLGTAMSHGCVRMNVSDCYWIFSHCNGSLIRISDTEPTPFGQTKRYWIPENQTYDPTDWNVPENGLSGPVW